MILLRMFSVYRAAGSFTALYVRATTVGETATTVTNTFYSVTKGSFHGIGEVISKN